VVFRDLGRGLFHPNRGAEIDGQAIGGLARLREGLGRHHAADADVDFEEIVEGDLRGGRVCGHGGVVTQQFAPSKGRIARAETVA